MAFTFRLKTSMQASISPAGDYGGAAVDAFPELSEVWGEGTGDNQANRFYYDERSLAISTAENLDLAALTPGPQGATVTLAEVKFLAIYWDAANTGNGQVKAGASNGWSSLFTGTTDAIKLVPGTTTYLVINAEDGAYPVAGSNKVINIENMSGTGAGAYKILVVGPAT
jgi:hypothetical protein